MPNENDRQPLVSVVIVNYNGQQFLETCVSSVKSSNYQNFEIILVDNCSTDGSVSLLHELFGNDSQLRLIVAERNLGPAAGRNVGTKIAKGKYLAFIDNDTEVAPLWLKEAVGAMENNSSIGAIQCKLLLMNDHQRFDYAGDYLSQFGFLVQRASFGEIDHGQLDKVVDIFAAKSAGMLVRRDVFNSVGRFDEDYFIIMEETDLCWRIWLNGYRVAFVPTSVVFHKFGYPSKLNSPRQKFFARYHGSKNCITTLIKDFDDWNALKVLPIHISVWAGISIWHAVKGQFDESNLIMKGILYNLINFKLVWSKRQSTQLLVRKVSDDQIKPIIMKKLPLTYFYNKYLKGLELGKSR